MESFSSRGNVLNCLLHLDNLLFVEPLVLDALDDLVGGDFLAPSSFLGSFTLFLLLLGLVLALSLSSFALGFEGLPVDLVHAVVLFSELHSLVGELLFLLLSLGSLLFGFGFSFLSLPLLLVKAVVLLSELHNLLSCFVLLSLGLEELLLLSPLVLELSVHSLVSLNSLLDGFSSRSGSNDVDEEGARLFAKEVVSSHREEVLDG